MTDMFLMPAINLLLQIIMLILIAFGVKLAKDKALRKHGDLMMGVVILNWVMIWLVMGPSFLAQMGTFIGGALTIGVAITLSHTVLGSLAQVLGITLVIRKFGNVKVWMRIVTVIWVIALIPGILFYLYYYVL